MNELKLVHFPMKLRIASNQSVTNCIVLKFSICGTYMEPLTLFVAVVDCKDTVGDIHMSQAFSLQGCLGKELHIGTHLKYQVQL